MKALNEIHRKYKAEPRELRATQGKETILVDSQFEEYDRQEQYPRIDLNTVESQGWTQYPWEPTDSAEPADQTQEWDHCDLGTPPSILGTNGTLLGQPQQSPRNNEITEIPETPPEGYWMSYQEELKLRLVYEEKEPHKNLLKLDNNTEKTCPCHRENCVCIGYIRHPDHGLRATIGYYDYSCKTHMQGKLDHSGIEPKLSPRMRQPEWKQQLAATA